LWFVLTPDRGNEQFLKWGYAETYYVGTGAWLLFFPMAQKAI
jgi:hypothetical protein